MAKQKKDGRYINFYLDRNLFNRLSLYSAQKGQTKTMAIERILKEHLDKEGIPEKVEDSEVSLSMF
jgi:hypothetical protein